MTYNKCAACGRDEDQAVPLFTSTFYQCPQPCIGRDGVVSNFTTVGGLRKAVFKELLAAGKCDNDACACQSDPADWGSV